MFGVLEGKDFHGLQLLQYCGGGAYGDVYFCQDMTGVRMALKIVSKQKLGDGWKRELKGVVNYRRLTEQAPELLRLFHVGEDDDCFYYTMEPADSAEDGRYVPDTLARRLEQGPLPQADVFPVLSEIFNGIRTIHKAGFAHRDIKPDNILFVNGKPKLGDIGLLSSLNSSLTMVAGTMEFLPPELRQLDSADASDRLSRKRNDLYALGKVIYCAVTGANPNEWPTVPKALLLSLSLKLFLRLSIRLCEKRPDRRLEDMEKIQAEFSNIDRELQYGETLLDKFSFWMTEKRATLRKCSDWLHKKVWRTRFSFWLDMAVVLLLVCAWFLGHPVDFSAQGLQQYKNATVGFTLSMPKPWKLADLNASGGRRDGVQEVFFCKPEDNLQDRVEIQVIDVSGKEMLESTGEARQRNMQYLYRGNLMFDTEIYESKREEINGISCVFVDLSYDRGNTRINNYLFLRKDKCISISLTAQYGTYLDLSSCFS